MSHFSPLQGTALADACLRHFREARTRRLSPRVEGAQGPGVLGFRPFVRHPRDVDTPEAHVAFRRARTPGIATRSDHYFAG